MSDGGKGSAPRSRRAREGDRVLEGEVMNGPYRIEMPAPQGKGIRSVQGTKIITPDGVELPCVLGVRVELDVNEIPVAYIKVPVRIVEVPQS